MKNKFVISKAFTVLGMFLFSLVFLGGCSAKQGGGPLMEADAASKVYVKPGTHDKFYGFFSGGFSGQVSVYGLPSGRLFKVIPVFSVFPENGYGFSEETKPMLMTSHGFVPWDDCHHPWLSRTNGVPDGRWLFINGNNTTRIARVNLSTFETNEIIEIPNSGGNHPSPYGTENTEYLVAGTRFSIPVPNKDVPISSYKKNFKGTISFIKVDPKTGNMDIAFQILVPGFNYDLARCGMGPSKEWCFFTNYNSEQAHTLLEINASQNDKDYVAAINWKKAEEYVKSGKAKEMPALAYHNIYDEKTMTARSEKITKVKVLDPKDAPGIIYYLPAAKSPHGIEVDPSGNYVTANGKLASQVTVFSFSKMLDAVKNKSFSGNFNGIPIINYDAALAGEVKNVGLGPLHTEFDGNGYAYTTCFISSEIVKWKLGTWEVVDRIPVYYSPGHLMIPGGDSAKPWGTYVVSLNKITKDRYLPTGPELCQSAQLIDISGSKMKMLLDFPTIGEPHYAQAIPADLIKSTQYYSIDDNKNPYATKGEKSSKVVRKGNRVDVYMTQIRSHFTPDNIEGVKVGDMVYFHVTNQEQDWDIPHGFAVYGNDNSELLVMPGQTKTLAWVPKAPGIYPFYCTDFCSALHQEMQGYVRVSPQNAAIPVSYSTGKEK